MKVLSKSLFLILILIFITSENFAQTISITPEYGLYFGRIPEGKAAVRDFLIFNSGSANLTVSNLRIEGAHSSNYTILENPGSFTLGIAQKTVISVKFIPASEGSKSAQVVIESNAGTSPDQIELTGEGTNLDNGFIAFERIFGNPDGDGAGSVRETADGGFIIGGSTTLLGEEFSDATIIKMDKYGQIEWSQVYGDDDWSESFSETIPTADGGYIAVGSEANSDDREPPDLWIVKTDASGTKIWDKSFGDDENDSASDVIQTSDGGYIIAGSFQHDTSQRSDDDAYVIKIDSNGNTLWEKTYGGVDGGEGAASIKATRDGNFVFIGSTSSYSTGGASDFDFYLVKINADGDVLWEKTFGGSDWEKAGSMLVDDDGSFLMAGWTASPEFGAVASEIFLAKADAAGNELWYKLYGWEHKDSAAEIIKAENGGYLIVGSTERYYDEPFETWRSDLYVIKTDASGNEQWSKTYGGLHEDGASCVRRVSDGGYIISGHTKSYSKDNDIYLLKIDGVGDFIPVIISENISPKVFQLDQNYPNPFNNNTFINYQLPQSIHVELNLYNVQGQQVRTLVNEYQQAGFYTIHFETNELASGLYLYQIKAGNFSVTKRMLFLK